VVPEKKNPHNIIRKSQPQVFSSAFCPSLEFPMLLLHLSHWSGRFCSVCARCKLLPVSNTSNSSHLCLAATLLSLSLSPWSLCPALVRAHAVAGAAGQQRCVAFSNSCCCCRRLQVACFVAVAAAYMTLTFVICICHWGFSVNIAGCIAYAAASIDD